MGLRFCTNHCWKCIEG